MKLLLVVGHPGVRAALSRLIRLEPDVDELREAESAEDALRALDAAGPDVVVMTVRLPDGSGIDACRQLRARSPDLRVILIASSIDERLEREAVEAGAAALLVSQLNLAPLLEAIRAPAPTEGDPP